MLNALLIDSIVKSALLEDLGRAGDITTDALIPADHRSRLRIAARRAGVVAGLDCVTASFRLLDQQVTIKPQCGDGAKVEPGSVVAEVAGPTRALLTGERTALNFLNHLSGIATATQALVEAVHPHKARVVCTRKTTPGLRALEKAAVRAGGGANHRLGLDDAILIKDNHLAALGSLRLAVERAKAAAGHLVKIEVEIDTLDQLREVLNLPIDAVLLDNMDIFTLSQAVRLVGGRFITEASGTVTPENIGAIAATGVDIISSGWITHSPPALDFGLDFLD